ncbi:MAG: CaiB/BaiF CoA transferase family protein [Acidimicrobiales bacterium]
MSTTSSIQPLQGVRVVELGGGVAVCYAGKLLADFGAEVIKIELPHGDPVRHWGPFPGEDPAVEVPEQSALHLHLNTNKRSAVVDLDAGHPGDLAMVRALAVGADIVVDALPPGRLEALGLGWEALHAANPALVLTRISPFGQDGPYAAMAGSEIALYAMGGPMHATGLAEREPLKLAGQLIAYQCGTVAAVATLGALLMAEQGGVGTHIDVSNLETQAASIDRRMVFLQQFFYNGRVMSRPSMDAQGLLPTGIYPAADGWVQVGTPPPYASRLLRTLQDEELAALLSDPAWVTNPDTPPLVEAALYAWLAERTTTEATAAAQPHHWPVTAVRTTAEVVADEHLAQRGFFRDVDHPVAGSLRQPGPPWRMDGGWSLRRAAPRLGEHTAEVRAEAAALAESTSNRPVAVPVAVPAAAGDHPGVLPLQGIRVLDLTQVWAGPYTTLLLGDLGADVIRVENSHLYNGTRGAVARPPRSQLENLGWLCAYPEDEPGDNPWNRCAFFNIHARNKRSVTIDLRRPEGLAAFLRLVEQSDVIVENNSVGVVDKLGIGWDAVRARNPRLIYLRMPALGLDGPMAPFVGFGSNFEALCGLTSLRGYPDLPPSMVGPVYYMDAATGAAGAAAVLMALRRRARTGHGELVELAQSENMLNLIGEYLIDAARTGRAHTSIGNRHLVHAPQGAYPCTGDDQWVVLSIDSDRAWAALGEVMGHPAWASDGRFQTEAGRRAHHDELDRLIGAWTATGDRWDITHRCQASGVIAAPVLGEADLAGDPQLRARGFFRRHGSDEAGFHDYPGHLWHWNGPPLRWEGLCAFAAANHTVWHDLVGLAEDELADLEAQGHLLDYFVNAKGERL